jgi:peptidyl-prolyl cis-trans isomerase D
MLKFLRGRKRSRNALLLVFVGVMALSLVGFFSAWSGGAAGLLRGAGGNDTVVAKVGSYEVTAKELKDSLTSFGQQIAQGQGKTKQDDLATLYGLYGPQVLDSLIRQKLILYEADRLSLDATDSEVESRLKQVFSPWPGAEQYRLRLQQAGITPVSFEGQLRASIAQEHLRSFITAAVELDPKLVEDEYRRNNTSYGVRWVEADPEKLRDKVQVTEADSRAYFEAHKADFRINTEQRRAHYIFVDPSKAGEAIQVSDDELKQDFDPERMVKQVRVSKIVLNVPKPTPDEAKNKNAADKKPDVEEEIRKKAQDIVQRAQGAEGKPAEDFAKLARELSEDPATKNKGGDIGWVNKNDKRDTDDPLNRVFNMQKDEVSQPVKKGDHYYILRVTDRRLPSFGEVRDDLLKAARARKGYSKAVEIAAEAEQGFKESKNAETVVADLNKKHGAQVASVKDTPFFSEGDALPELGSASEFESSIFELQNPSDVSDRMNVDKGFAIGQYAEKRDPHDPAFEEVKDKVDKAYRSDKAKDLVLERAKEVAKARTPDELKQLGTSMGLKVDERLTVSGSDSIGPLTSEASRAPVYKLNIGEITKDPIKADNNVYVVVALMNRKDADMGEPFQKERKSIEQRLLDEKRNVFFSTYLALTEKQLKDAGKIKVYDDAIATAVQSAGGAAPAPGQPQLPAPGGRAPRRRPSGAQGLPGTLPGRR